MALEAFLDLLMFGWMAEGAVQGGVFARELSQFFTLFGMTGLAPGADRRHVIHCDVQRCVRITMTLQAVWQFEMLLGVRSVAHGTLRDGFGSKREMLKVAIETANFGLMLAAITLNVCGLCVVALAAISVLEFSLHLGFNQSFFFSTDSLGRFCLCRGRR